MLALIAGAADAPVNVKILAEGEEEISSPHAGELLRRERDRLACDAVLIADQPMLDRRTPLILYGVRGCVYAEVEVRGTPRDLHSGTYGGAVDNPALVLARMLASLMDGESRRVLVPGFYDDVRDVDPAEFAGNPVDDAVGLAMTGARALAGEAGYPLAQRVSVRPTLEVNGMVSGYTGPGRKSVIPAAAVAKLGCRLVPDQRPEEVFTRLRDHLLAVAPPTVAVEVRRLAGGRPAVMDRDAPLTLAAVRAYREVVGAAPVFLRGGGSEPVVPELLDVLGAPVTMVGYGLPTDNIHAPDEHLAVEQLHLGVECTRRTLAVFGARAIMR